LFKIKGGDFWDEFFLSIVNRGIPVNRGMPGFALRT
jgi:hypothetical protein